MSDTMQESDWSEPVPKKRGVPKWIWWVAGLGCLGVLVVGGAIAAFAFWAVDKATDEESAWAEVAEVLPHDERPAGWKALGMGVMGIENYTLTSPDFAGMILMQSFPAAQPLDGLMDPDSRENGGAFGVGGIKDAAIGTLELQGRSVRCLRFRPWVPGESAGPASLRVDLSGGTLEPHALLQITPTGGQELSDEEVGALLAPFDVWRGR